MPMRFTPCDPVHAATFTSGSREEIEARHRYCSLAWGEQLFNEVLAARFASGNTVELLEDHLDYVLGAARRMLALGVSHYDYLALKQSEPNLADAFAHADAVPRNSLRGDGARRFLSPVVRAEASTPAKIGAAERGFSYPQRAARANAPAPAPNSRAQPRNARNPALARGHVRNAGGRGRGANRA